MKPHVLEKLIFLLMMVLALLAWVGAVEVLDQLGGVISSW